MKKKRDNDEMSTTSIKQNVDRKKRIKESYAKAVKQNGKALERLSKK